MNRAQMVQPLDHYDVINLGEVTGVVAAGAGDNVEVDGPWIEVAGRPGISIVFNVRDTLTAAETLTIAANLQDATDSVGTGVADFGTALAATVVNTGAATDARVTLKWDINIEGARDWIRLQFTPNLSAGAADTADISVLGVVTPLNAAFAA